MKYTIAIILLFLSGNIYSQSSSDSALINLESDGLIVNLQSENFSNNTANFPVSTDRRYTEIELGLTATGWKFTKCINIGGQINLNGYYFYGNLSDGDFAKVRSFYGSIFGEADYYPFENDFYATISSGNRFVNTSTESSPNVLLLTTAGKGSINYLWGGVGYGRIINTASKTKEENFEDILFKQRVIAHPFSSSLKKKIETLIEKRNNKDFISEYIDNADALFFKELQSVLRKENIIEGNLDAETTIKLYQTLTNDRYLYYPNYSGFQVQSELQAQLNYDYFNHFLTTGGIVGMPVSEKTNFLFSGFLALPLNKHSNAEGLFNRFKNPFTNYLPVILQQYKIDNANYIDNQENFFDFSENQDFFVGANAIMFYKFDEYAGVRGYFSSIINKPKASNANSLSTFGTVLDYNIFSRLTLNLNLETKITNEYFPDFYYNLGFLWNIY